MLSGHHGVSQWEGSPGAGGSWLRAPASRSGLGGLCGRRRGAVRGCRAVSAVQHYPPAADLRQVRPERRFRLLRRPRPGEVRQPPRLYCFFPGCLLLLREWRLEPGARVRGPEPRERRGNMGRVAALLPGLGGGDQKREGCGFPTNTLPPSTHLPERSPTLRCSWVLKVRDRW